MKTQSAQRIAIDFGCERFGRLTTAMLHRPDRALSLINAQNHRQWLFDSVPDASRFIEEHDRYRELLTCLGVKVLELADYVSDHRDLMSRLPNLVYLHDVAVVTRRGALLSKMAWPARQGEDEVVAEALNNLGVPVLNRFEAPDDAFEGCLLLSPKTMLIAETERHSHASIQRFLPTALDLFEEVIVAEVPKARRYMHPDTIYNRITDRLALAYPPVLQQVRLYTPKGCRSIDFFQHMRRKGVEVLGVSDDEQRRLACTFVPLAPGIMLHYDNALDRRTQLQLARRGVELILFHPDALIAGGGSLRCLTLRLHRQAES